MWDSPAPASQPSDSRATSVNPEHDCSTCKALTRVVHNIAPGAAEILGMIHKVTSSVGSRGNAVVELQRALANAGFSPGSADGAFGPKTKAAVIAFQRARGLSADGIVGPKTWAALTAPTPRPAAAAPAATGGTPTLRQGARGGAVTSLQQALARAGFSPGSVDGSFGPKTGAAVIAFQRARGLSADGVVGPKTWGALRGNSTFTPGTGSSTPVPSSTASGWRERVLNEARKHLGFHESGTNGNPFSRHFGRPAEAWCADFVSYCYSLNGHPLNQPWTPALTQTLKNNGTWNRWSPEPGDIVMFDWKPGSGTDHTGLVERVYSSGGQMYVQTIEGNSSDMVKRKTYPLSSSVIQGFGHV